MYISTKNSTPFITIYNRFYSRVTSDMYMELTEVDTVEILQDLLVNGIPRFKNPRFDIYDYEEGWYDSLGTYTGVESDYIEVPVSGWIDGAFSCCLTRQEINILSLCMVIEWLGQQLVTTENTKMKYSGSDFKMSSQANHMSKLDALRKSMIEDCNSLQKSYRRRVRTEDGLKTVLDSIMEVS